MTDPVTAPDMVSVIQVVLAKHQRFDASSGFDGCTCLIDQLGNETASLTEPLYAHQARAVLAAISEAGTVEWGVAWDGITVDPMEAVSHDAAKATAARLTRLSNDGDPAYAITRITFPWERAE